MAWIIFGVDGEGLVVFILLFLLTLFLSRAAYILFRRGFDIRLGKRRSKMYARGIEYAIIATGLSFGLTQIFQVDFTAIAATLGLAGIVIALASQQILQNVLAGMLMGVERQVQLEDWVDIGGLPETKPARVKDITLTKTILLDPQGKMIIVPNSVIMSSKVINYTKAGFFEVPLRLTVNMDEDFERVKKIVLEEADSDPHILPNVPKEEKVEVLRVMHLRRLISLFENKISFDIFSPRVLIADISDGKVTLSIRIWIREVNRRDDFVSEFLDRLYIRLKAENIRLV